MHITGQTKDGIYMIGGCFAFYATRGVPVPLIVSELHAHDMMVDWINFCEDALEGKWTLGKAYAVLREAVGDTYSPTWIAEWEKHLTVWCYLCWRNSTGKEVKK